MYNKKAQKKYYQEHIEERKEKSKKRYQENKEKIKLRVKKYAEDNPEKIKKYKEEHKEGKKIYNKDYYWKNPEYHRERTKNYKKNNPEKVKQYKQKYKKENPEKIKEYSKKYYCDNEKEINEYSKKYKENNPEKIKKTKRKYEKNRRKIDPQFRLNGNIATKIGDSLRGQKAKRHWEDLVGYTLEKLMIRLEFQFDKNMNWENYGPYWHIDHKKPKSLFKYKQPEEQAFKDCWCLANLQPMEKIKNMKKSNYFKGRSNEIIY